MTRVLALALLLLGATPAAVLASEGGGGLINLDRSLIIQAINFALLLFMATVVTGLYWVAERTYFLPQRRRAAQARYWLSRST